jgi:hypothetical protein
VTDKDNSPELEVGYGRPPEATRFRKGTSGNPNGRPRKAKPASRSFNVAHDPTINIILEEAYRTIKVKDVDTLTEVPTIQAVMRSMVVKALKGDRTTQALFTKLVKEAEDHKRAEQFEFFKFAVELKEEWRKTVEKHRQRGTEVPNPIPHPDDFEIDVDAGIARFKGPWNEEEDAVCHQIMDVLDIYQRHYVACLKRLKKTPDDKDQLKRRRYLERDFKKLNLALPKRYRKILKDRSVDA